MNTMKITIVTIIILLKTTITMRTTSKIIMMEKVKKLMENIPNKLMEKVILRSTGNI